MKLAVIERLTDIVTETGLEVLAMLPLQLKKLLPAAGWAVSCTTVPEVYCVPRLQLGAGLALIVPLPGKLTAAVRV